MAPGTAAYPTDLTDREWEILEPVHVHGNRRRGRPRLWPVRRVLDAVFYVLRSGCPWRLLPHDFPPWQTVFYHFRRWRLDGVWYRLHEALRAATRQREDRHPGASAAILDSQSVKTTEEAGAISGYDAAKGVKGRKRHLLVDSSGLVLSVLVSPASTQDRDGARALLAGLAPLVPRLERIWADGAYSGKALAEWCHDRGGWTLEVVNKRADVGGFEVLPKRWVVERPLSWLAKRRSLRTRWSKNDENWLALVQFACAHIPLR